MIDWAAWGVAGGTLASVLVYWYGVRPALAWFERLVDRLVARFQR